MFYEQFVVFDHESGGQKYARCPFHTEDTPSFTVNVETNEWYCHGCGRGGAEKEFVQLYFDVTPEIARYAFGFWEKKGQWPFPTDEQIAEWRDNLLNRPTEIAHLREFGWSDEIMEQFKVGFEDCRIMIPVKSRNDLWVNVRKYLPPHRRGAGGRGAGNAKCINIRNLGSRRYMPYEAFKSSEPIYVVEGEKDMLAARSQGLNAVTSTGGSAIPTDEAILFKDKDVMLMLDTDSVGERSTETYIRLLSPIAKSIQVVTLPCKDFSDYWQTYHTADVSQYTRTLETIERAKEQAEAQDVSLVRSEFTEHLNIWVKLKNMSVVGVEPKIYTIPTKLRLACTNQKCTRPCPLMVGTKDSDNQVVEVDPRQMLQFVDASDNAQDTYAKKLFGCKHVTAIPVDFTNVQKLIFQESASFIDGLDEASFENRYGIYMYSDYRLSATLKYNFEACRVTDPRSQQNYYVIRSAEGVAQNLTIPNEQAFAKLREVAGRYSTASDLIEHYYQEWISTLDIEGRADLFGTLLLTYCSVTEIPWQGGVIKGWLDSLVIGDTRTGKSKMAQRFVKAVGMGGYINGENARNTGVIGGVQRFGDSWVVTWGAIPMNDRGLLIIDEASGLDVEDIKNLSSTRSSGAVTLNKIVKGEARARTRLLWLTNPRSGKNLSDYYWRGYGAFQEFIPVAEDQARFDLVLSAAREDIEVLQGVESDKHPNIEAWRNLFSIAWQIPDSAIALPREFKSAVREMSAKLNEDLGGGPLIVGVAVHEKLLRLACAFAVLSGKYYDGVLKVQLQDLQYADEFLRAAMYKSTFGYGAYIAEFKRAQKKRSENTSFIRGLVTLHPALKTLLSSSGFKGFQFQEILGIERSESSKMLSDLITRGLLRPTTGATYVPDKMLMEVAKEMEV